MDDRFNTTAPSAPMGSNLFFDPGAGLNLRGASEPPALLIDFQAGKDPGNHIPPDPQIAVGPNHVILAENSRFFIFDKQGNSVLTVNATG